MSDDLLRRFRDKIRNRSAARGRESGAPDAAGATGLAGEAAGPAARGAAPAGARGAPVPAIAVREAAIGAFPEAARLHPLFVPGVPRVRVTLDVDDDLRDRAARLTVHHGERLLSLCPTLPRHSCGAGDPLQALTRRQGRPDGIGSAASVDGVALAHLIEHVAIDLAVLVSGGGRCSGVTCAWRDRLDRFDIFLECPEPGLGRAAVLLACDVVRDLCEERQDIERHRRCRDLLAALAARGRRDTVPEDVCDALAWPLAESLETLDRIARFGYLERFEATFTFSSPSGVLFRPAPPAATIDLAAIFPATPSAPRPPAP